ncbi:MAG: hypothetical protein ACREDZ_11365 [Kiloniellales bacterium]
MTVVVGDGLIPSADLPLTPLPVGSAAARFEDKDVAQEQGEGLIGSLVEGASNQPDTP